MKSITFFWIICFAFLSCKKNVTTPDIPDQPMPDEEPSLNVLWLEPLSPTDTAYHSSFQPLIYNNDVLFSLRFFSDRDLLFFRDGATGELVWEWQDHLDSGYSSRYGKARFNDKMCYTTGDEFYLIDLNIGESIWAFEDINCTSARITLIDDQFYYTSKPCGTNTDASILLRTSLQLNEPRWDTVFVLNSSNNNGYRPHIELPSLWIHPNGDSILIFQNRQYHFTEMDGKVDLYAFNQSQDTILWLMDDITLDGKSSVEPPYIYKDKVYFFGRRNIQCFDALTGTLIWKKDDFVELSEHFFTSNMFIKENIFIAKADNDYIYGLDPETGSVIWKQTETGGSVTAMVYHKGVVYFSSGGDCKLYAVEVATGKLLWGLLPPSREDGYHNACFFTGGPSIDEETNRLYISDGHFAICIQLDD